MPTFSQVNVSFIHVPVFSRDIPLAIREKSFLLRDPHSPNTKPRELSGNLDRETMPTFSLVNKTNKNKYNKVGWFSTQCSLELPEFPELPEFYELSELHELQKFPKLPKLSELPDDWD